jgi:secreted trypsin-like serine protease
MNPRLRNKTAVAALALALCVALAAAVGAGSAEAGGPTAHASIIDGEPAVQGALPWLAYVVNIKTAQEEIESCTGTVVAPRMILTAGHCAEDPESEVVEEPDGYRIITGNVNWTSTEREVMHVRRVLVFPRYEPQGFLASRGDVALLELSTPTQAPPIRVSPRKIWKPGTQTIVTGWGNTRFDQQPLTEELQRATMFVRGDKWCEQHGPGYQFDAQICVVDAPSYKSTTCNGDSGGPLLMHNPKGGQLIEIGTLSEGFGKCSKKRPALYTRSDFFYSWMKKRIRESNALPVSP